MESPSAASPAPKTYRVGTLNYTRAALVQVMFWMLLGVVFFQLLQMLPSTALPLQLRWAGASDTLIGFKSSLSFLVAEVIPPEVIGKFTGFYRALGALGSLAFTRWAFPWIEPTLGLSLDEFGKVKGWTFLVQIPVFLVVGSFVDRFHPMRVAVVGMLSNWTLFLQWRKLGGDTGFSPPETGVAPTFPPAKIPA